MTRGSNPLPPGRMTAAERRKEVCALLALGVIRIRLRHSDFQETVRSGDDRATTHPGKTERKYRK